MDLTELLLHPVRLRIVQATMDGSPFTTSQLCARLPDVSKATMYRQVAALFLDDLKSMHRRHPASGCGGVPDRSTAG